jgi:DnaJ like chaperone protein
MRCNSQRVTESVWGKIIGGMAGFAMGGPFGAVLGMAIGHAAENGGLGQVGAMRFSLPGADGLTAARLAALLGQREHFFAVASVVLSAKLAKCDGPVNRAEIDAFKRSFRIPPESALHVGRLFDQARESADGYELYAKQLGDTFADNRAMLEEVLAALFMIARADKPVTVGEQEFLRHVHLAFGLDEAAWERASGARSRGSVGRGQDDPYAVLGLQRGASDEEVRATWKRLMRENHPDSMASRGVPAEFIARTGDKVALINAAWDRIKRERSL